MIINADNKDAYLRAKSRFYRAGWFASEYGENPQEFTGDNPKFKEYYEDYIRGYGDEVANSASLEYDPNTM